MVHFEVVGRDGEKLQGYYAELFDWEVNAENEMKYGLVDREARRRSKDRPRRRHRPGPRGLRAATSPSTSKSPTSRRP